jgi:hypothetical protein
VLVLASLDAAALLLGLLGALRLPGVAADRIVPLAPLLVGVWVVVFAAFRLYDRAPVRRNPGAFIGASFCWAGLALAGAAVYPESGLGPAVVLVAAALALLAASALRLLFERGVARVYRRGLGQTPVLVAGREPDRSGCCGRWPPAPTSWPARWTWKEVPRTWRRSAPRSTARARAWWSSPGPSGCRTTSS